MKRLTWLLGMLGFLGVSAGAADIPYVIKVTPTLVYLDVGKGRGVEMGDMYLILRPRAENEPYVWVGEVEIIRVFDAFSIAEIISVVEDEEIEILQQAIFREDWEVMSEAAAAEKAAAVPSGQRFIYILGGGELGKGVDLWRDEANEVVGFERISELGLGIRLGNFLGEKWRLNLTYRVSGKSLGAGAGDVSQFSMELDMHYLFKGRGKSGPYLGLGLGGHRLGWDVERPRSGSSSKLGVNLLGGVEFPFGRGHWSMVFEGGYQWVDEWGTGRISTSSMRSYLGLGRNF